MRAKRFNGLAVLAAMWVGVWAFAGEAATPLVRAHAHNDYLHARPLLDALDQGFCSVEADINLIEGELRVAHSPSMTRPGRTLQALYLDPLRERVKANGGHVYTDGPPFWLLIDIKTESKPTYEALAAVLASYADILTVVRDGKVIPGAASVVVDNADELIAAQDVRYASVDGRLDDLDANPPAELVPWVSESWKAVFTWNGKGPMPEAEKAKLGSIVARAHEQGRKIRFWALPGGDEAVWQELYDAGVDMLNADNLVKMREFLVKRGS